MSPKDLFKLLLLQSTLLALSCYEDVEFECIAVGIKEKKGISLMVIY